MRPLSWNAHEIVKKEFEEKSYAMCASRHRGGGELGSCLTCSSALLLSQLEFTVQMSCQSCVDAVHKTLKGAAGKSRINLSGISPGVCV